MEDKVENKIPIGGFQKQSLIDYPGNVSAIIFTSGCNFQCNYCHNPGLVYPDLISKTRKFNNNEIFEWLENNKNLLDAVVITGGEPTIHASLPGYINLVKQLGLKVKLDTNGTNPGMLEKLILNEEIDFVAMDIKAPLILDNYRKVVGEQFNSQLLKNIKCSIELLGHKNVAYEFRTTLDESIGRSDILSISNHLTGDYYIQALRKDGIEVSCELFYSIIDEIKEAGNGLNIKFR